jgi:hypothetical protein
MAKNRRSLSVSPTCANEPTDNLPQFVDKLIQISDTSFDNNGRLKMNVNYAPPVDEAPQKVSFYFDLS